MLDKITKYISARTYDKNEILLVTNLQIRHFKDSKVVHIERNEVSFWLKFEINAQGKI